MPLLELSSLFFSIGIGQVLLAYVHADVEEIVWIYRRKKLLCVYGFCSKQ